MVQAFIIEYPQALKGLYGDVIARISKTFNYRNMP